MPFAELTLPCCGRRISYLQRYPQSLDSPTKSPPPQYSTHARRVGRQLLEATPITRNKFNLVPFSVMLLFPWRGLS